MPRIRKKTSKRGTLNQRARIAQKVKETHRKQKRAAKKNPPKKSKPKDPGIPNAFPFKDQILAEIAEQRRQAAEEKQRRKEEKKNAKSSAAEGGSDASGDEGDGTFDGVLALNASARSAPRKAPAAEPMEEGDSAEVEEDAPMLVNPDLPNLKAVLNAADVVVEVLEARDPLAARSAHLEELARESGKRVLLVLNKIDLCPREAVEAWASTLRKEHPTVLFRSASACLPAPAESVKGKGKERADDAWGLNAILAILKQWAGEKKGDKAFTIAIVGVTNVGKSSVANSLLRKAALQTYKPTSTPAETPTTTMFPQEVTLELEGKEVRIIDTPGLSWHPAEDASEEEVGRTRARDVLLRNRGRIERLKDTTHVMSEIVSRATREDLMLLYNLPIFTEGDANAFLTSVARANRFSKKRGDPDLTAAARLVLRDWSSGKFARYTVPPSSSSADSSAPTDSALSEAYAKDQTVLSRLPTRKELRKAGGLVKLRAGTIDARKPTLDESYSVGSDDEGDEEDGADLDSDDGDLDEEASIGSDEEGDEEDDDDDEEDEEEDEEEDDEDEDEEEEEEVPSPRGKRKRSATKAAAPARPAKKVAFAAEPKNTKQARSAAGAKGTILSKAKARAAANDDKPAKKSALKKAAPAKPAAPAKKAANSSSGSKKAAVAKEGEETYDFKQFF